MDDDFEFTEDQKEVIVLMSCTNPITPELLQKARDVGFIAKSELIDGQSYYGYCRNASKATWHKDRNCFDYMRHKFSCAFLEDINHFEDDDGYDVFIPVQKVEG